MLDIMSLYMLLPWIQDAAWQRIKAKQDDMDSQASNVSPSWWLMSIPFRPPQPLTNTQVEVTFIDDALETGTQEVSNLFPGDMGMRLHHSTFTMHSIATGSDE